VSLQTRKFINQSINDKDKYNIITFPTHERFESDLCKTGHDFYGFIGEGMKTWDASYAEVPNNYYMMPQNSLPSSIDYDFILANSKFGHLQAAYKIANVLKIPIISMECTVPTINITNEQLNNFRQMTGDFNVFLTDYSKEQWSINGESIVIPHGIDTDIFKPNHTEKKPQVLSIVNDWINRDYCCNWQGYVRITNEGKEFPTRIVGKTEGLSEPTSSVEELVQEYNSSQVFLNTSTYSPIPTVLLEAMACGCAVVTTATCEIPNVIKNGVNGFMSNDENELRGYCKQLLEDEELRNKMGAEARGTILALFSEEKFIENWNSLFTQVYRTGRS
jgi:glycosyltransferase involved in cell wall biosynthesis